MNAWSGSPARCRAAALAAAAVLPALAILWGALTVRAAPGDAPPPKADEKVSPKADEKPAPKVDEKAAPKADEKPAPKADEKPAAKADEKAAVPPPPPPMAEPDEGPNLKSILLGGRQRVEVPRLPQMSIRGFIHAQGRAPAALLEIKEINRTFVVREGSEIPIMVAGRIAPPRDIRTELIPSANPKAGTPAAAARPADPRDQTQVILKVKSISNEGVVVEAGVLAQTLIIR